MPRRGRMFSWWSCCQIAISRASLWVRISYELDWLQAIKAYTFHSLKLMPCSDGSDHFDRNFLVLHGCRGRSPDVFAEACKARAVRGVPDTFVDISKFPTTVRKIANLGDRLGKILWKGSTASPVFHLSPCFQSKVRGVIDDRSTSVSVHCQCIVQCTVYLL